MASARSAPEPARAQDAPPFTVGIVGAGRLGSALLKACADARVPVSLRARASTGWTVESVPAVLIDAGAPDGFPEVAAYCLRHSVPLLECVSHLRDTHPGPLSEVAAAVPVLEAVNLSFGSYLQRRIAGLVAAAHHLTAPVVDVLDRHPVRKAARVSATAQRLAAAWTDAGGHPGAELGLRRGGPEVSEHSITWTWGAEEALTVHHQVTSLHAVARTALGLARHLPGRAPGLVTVDEVFDTLSAAPWPTTQ
ncbi:dihydrodipicolinate reductase C-terminal domain-containing protein [Streptomyces indicus]|uniref:dihydrodipicolinate reductase C-terminal domain-containing protein n=1 Tax=Streptomyces indicus TaxID=417292 RepID=UPI000B89E1ED|nr:dihydrodipicolinate reductase C-terminal domain-containing protein [Streptomyces indicus]